MKSIIFTVLNILLMKKFDRHYVISVKKFNMTNGIIQKKDIKIINIHVFSDTASVSSVQFCHSVLSDSL